MARTTGYPNAIVARLLASGELKRPGVSPPELLASDQRLFDRMVEGLKQRRVELTLTVA